MVKKSYFLAVILVLSIGLMAFGTVNAQNIVYSIDHEYSQIFINQDGTIDLTYNITLTVTTGVINGFYVGQLKSDFTPGQAADQYGNQLHVADATSGSDYRVDVTLNQPLTAGQSVWFTVTTNVAGMISNDTQNPGNYGLQFAPQWTDIPINDVRIQIVLPTDVPANEVATQTLPNGNSTVDGKYAVYWQIQNLTANEQHFVGVSFPAKYLPNYIPSATSSGFGNLGSLANLLPLIVLPIIAIAVIIAVIGVARKSSYASPKVSMETLGIKRGLTAVEASYLLDMKPTQIVTEILYSLLQKRAVWATQTNPALKLQILSPYENKTGPPDNPLRFYEVDFLNSLKADGALAEEKLAHTIMFLRDTVEQKLQGYSRKDTVDYYKKIVDQAWSQVQQAGTEQLASNAYNEQLLWLLLDPNQKTKTETVFQNRVFQPDPLWFWWWYGYTTYHPHPTYQPNIQVPTQSGKPPTIPGTDFANTIATSVEKTSNNIVVNIEKFANSIIPPPPKASHEPARNGADCVCACAACACACACVSCACACAGGGAH
jgi:hypothetical protein